MSRYRLFAAGVSVALLFGAATPALAKPDKAKGHAYGHSETKPKPDPQPDKPGRKPTKAKPVHVNGGGTLSNDASFSVQVRADKKRQGHFNYTSTTWKVRCKAIETVDRHQYVTAGDPAATITANCVRFGPNNSRTPIWVRATFWDRAPGDDDQVSPTAAPGPKDAVEVNLYSDSSQYTSSAAPLFQYTGDLKDGNVKVR